MYCEWGVCKPIYIQLINNSIHAALLRLQQMASPAEQSSLAKTQEMVR